MTKHFQVYLSTDSPSVTYSCVHCRAHLSDHKDLISKSFQGSHGRAYLFDKVVNVEAGVAEDRLLLTGQHRVADLHCSCCRVLLGWKYEKAFEPSQRYKEGKCIIELANLIKENGWDNNLTPRMKRGSSGYSTTPHMSPITPPWSPADENWVDFGGWRNQGFFDSTGELFEQEALTTEESANSPSTSFDNRPNPQLSTNEPSDIRIETADGVTYPWNYVPTFVGEDRRGSRTDNTENVASGASDSSVALFNTSETLSEQKTTFVTCESSSFPLEDEYSRSNLFTPWDVEIKPNVRPFSIFSLTLGRLKRSYCSRYTIDPSVPLLSATEEVLGDPIGTSENRPPLEKRLTASISLDNVFFSRQKDSNPATVDIISHLPMVSADVCQSGVVGEPVLWYDRNVADSSSSDVFAAEGIKNYDDNIFNALD